MGMPFLWLHQHDPQSTGVIVFSEALTLPLPANPQNPRGCIAEVDEHFLLRYEKDPEARWLPVNRP